MDSKSRASSKSRAPAATTTRKPSTRVKAVVDYDEKRHLPELADEVPRAAVNGLTELEERVRDLNESWETESLFEDALEDLTEDKFFDGPEACTPDEAVHFRQLLRTVGPEVFCKRTVDAGVVTAKKLLTAFGIRPPAFLEGAEDDAYFSLLSLALSRELSKRAKLSKYNSVDDAVNLIKRSRNIIVLTGAGISTSLGIPDFRSKGTGLYSKLEHLGLNDPQEVFDISVFRSDPTIFYTVARDILPSTSRFSPTHAFIAMLQEKGKLLTNYSQNIDNLEAKAGIRPEKLVQCHGSFATASCFKCGYKVDGDSLFPEIKAGKIPRCRKCAQGSRTTNNSRKRKLNRDGTEKKVRRKPGDYDSNSDSEFDLPTSSCGVMKPDITFFGEPLPDEFSKRLTEHDRDLVDLVIVIGTSLKVAPVSEVVPFLPSNIPQIYISRTPVSHVNFDIDLLGDCDIVVSELCRRAGWDLKHEMIPEGQVISTTLADGYPSRHIFAQVKPDPDSESIKVEAPAETADE
ncbi:DHS-like NAD/FAD-binding domain-containing protein [Lasiosphaeria miniovina]|uniref:DHS-like NAD/FAD-binding domain-containing protein n=1 Tax=Lasiosphaeria miniovina TaxID=1954250 RepID=A0AA40DNE1_9PEZI|nr:DHS-like NAD/FAD-binding domain-containing protein [Lasiosphaeria miniovina]KAK0709580.1 DHS-like NAD/FAD-binding domain-containing protein [Lasiosphaeria miniovina]